MKLVDLIQSTLPKYSDTIPSTNKKIWFRPFIVKEEKILLIVQETGSEKEILSAIKEIVQNCFSIADAGDIPIFDLEYLFLKLRSKSVSELVEPILICPETGEKIKLSIDLSKIKVKTFKKHTNQIKINDEILISMKYPTLNMFIEKETSDMSLMDFYELAMNCIDYIETPSERIECSSKDKLEIKEFVDNLTKDQFDKIIEFFATMPRIEQEAEYQTSDKVKRKVVLRGIRDFFG
jgi:hypothetical protein